MLLPYSVHLLYWYKRTHTDAEARSFVVKAFTLLLPYSVHLLYWCKSTHTDAEARSFVVKAFTLLLPYSVHLLYWYKSTHTDAEARSFVVKAFTLLLPSSVSLLYLLSSVFAKVRQYVYLGTSTTSKLLPICVLILILYCCISVLVSRILCYILSNPKP